MNSDIAQTDEEIAKQADLVYETVTSVFKPHFQVLASQPNPVLREAAFRAIEDLFQAYHD